MKIVDIERPIATANPQNIAWRVVACMRPWPKLMISTNKSGAKVITQPSRLG